MQGAAQFALVLVSVPDLKTGRKLARLALKARLIACANIIPRLESHYWWQDKIESGAEVLLILKTRRSRLKSLEALVLDNHPYDTPEFVVVPLRGGSERYLQWVASVCPAN
jgi:periplasmic divalent cation tolerance protein